MKRDSMLFRQNYVDLKSNTFSSVVHVIILKTLFKLMFLNILLNSDTDLLFDTS